MYTFEVCNHGLYNYGPLTPMKSLEHVHASTLVRTHRRDLAVMVKDNHINNT